MVVDQRGKQAVGRADRVEIAVEVQIDVFHRDHLRPPATGRAALHSETRPQRWFAQADDRIETDPVEGIAQAHAGGCLAFARRGWCDRGNQHQLAVRAVGQTGNEIEAQFGLVVTERNQGFGRDPEPRLGDRQDWIDLRRTGNLDVRSPRRRQLILLHCHCRARVALPPNVQKLKLFMARRAAKKQPVDGRGPPKIAVAPVLPDPVSRYCAAGGR